MNAGYDEIIEIVKEKGPSDQYHHPSRNLIKFKNEEIKVIDEAQAALMPVVKKKRGNFWCRFYIFIEGAAQYILG